MKTSAQSLAVASLGEAPTSDGSATETFFSGETAPVAGEQGNFGEGAVEFWLKELAGAPPALELPFDFPRATKAAGARVLRLDWNVSDSVKKIGAAEAATPFVTLLASFQTLLHRWTHQTDFVVGSPLGEARPATHESNSAARSDLVPLRTDAASDPSFREMLCRTRGRVAAAAARPLRFDVLLDQLLMVGSPDVHPVFQVLFELQPGSRSDECAAGAAAASPASRPEVSAFDLAMKVEASPAGWVVTLESGQGRFSAETLDRLLQSFAVMLAGIVANPNTRLSQLPILPAGELQQLFSEFNDTALAYDRNACLHELFARQVAASPNAIAIVGANESWTYAQLDAAAERLAVVLSAHAVGPDVLVGVLLHRTPQLLAGILGVLKAGGAYVPLDPAYPAERLRFIIEDTRMPVLVTETALAGAHVNPRAQIICIDALPAERDRPAPPSPSPRPRADNLAYCIYTSGSTGKPKGVCVTHQCVVALIAWASGLYSAAELAGIFFSTSACFDVSVFESLVPLCLGGRILIGENLLEIGTHAARGEVTLVSGVPSAMAEVVRSRSLPPSVRTVNLAGEPCPQSLVDDLYALGHVEKVYDVYGPTETTVYSVGGLRHAGGAPTIGRPLPNERVYLLDAQLQPVPRGVRGELFIGGEKVARGYLRRPELTAAKFMEAPCVPGERLYRTGDAARWGADGSLEFLGRLDRQVKIRGYRVEPAEVEAALRTHDSVRECAVLPRTDAMGTAMLVAYIVGNASTPDGESLRRHLQTRVPEYLIPGAFIALAALPRAPNGKLDAKALPAPTLAQQRREAYAAPRDAVEQQLVRVWEEVLGMAPIGIHDRFFDLGGHSLLALRMAAQVGQKFGREVPISILFKAPTVAQLAEAIRKNGLIAARSSVVELQPTGSRPPIFWLHTLGGGGGAGLFIYEKLARLLGPDQPSYGLIASNETQPEAFEELAARYVGDIRAVQPQGPYYLGGYCFGGMLAYEVARQLAAGGDEIAMVVLLDAAPPIHPAQPGLASGTFLRHLRHTLPEWLAEAWRDREKLPARVSACMGRLFRHLAGRKRMQSDGRTSMPLTDVMDMEKYPDEYRAHAEAHWRAVSRYQPRHFPCRVLLLRPHRPRLLMYNPEFQWRLWGHEVELKLVSGDHTNLLAEPQVSEVAAAIVSALGPAEVEAGQAAAA